MVFSVHGVYSPEVTKKVLLARIECETERQALDAFVQYTTKRAKIDGRKFAKNFTLKKDGKKEPSYTIFFIGANVLNGISLYLVKDGDIDNGKTIARLPFPAKEKTKKKKGKK